MTFGDITGVIHAAGVSTSQASAVTILPAGLYGTAVVLEEFGSVIAPAEQGSSRRSPAIDSAR